MDARIGLQRLEAALRTVLGVHFDSCVQAEVESEGWYHASLAGTEIFTYWVRDRLEKSTDSLWLFGLIRPSERTVLAEQLGIDRDTIRGKTPSDLAAMVAAKLGFPIYRLASIARITRDWRDIANCIDGGEEEKAAVQSRQRAERLLRRILYFFSSTGVAPHFLSIIDDPGSLSIPEKLTRLLAQPAEAREALLIQGLKEDGWADLGFLALALRKLSSALEKAGTMAISGRRLVLFTPTEHESFTNLARALQAYAHDRPSAHATRSRELSTAVAGIQRTVGALIERDVIPEELLVLEVCSSVLGPVLRGLNSEGTDVFLASEPPPPVGSRILAIASARRAYAKCVWADSPWLAD